MKFIFLFLFLIFSPPSFSRDIAAKDINELHRIPSFSCTATQTIHYRAGKKSLKRAKNFRIPIKPGGYAKLHSRSLNFLFEAHFSQGIQFSLKQLDGLKDFPYKMKKLTDKKSFVKVNVNNGKNTSVFSLNCKRK